MKFTIILFTLLLLHAIFIYGEESEPFSIAVTPVGIIPFGENASSFKMGGGVDLAVDFSLGSIPFVFVRTSADYEYIPLASKDGLSIFSVSAGAGLKYTLFEKLTLSASGTGGYYYGFMTDNSGSSGGNISLSGGVSAFFNITPSFSLGISADYTSKTALYSSLGLSIGTTIYPGRFGSSAGSNQYAPSVDLLEARSPGVSGSGLDIEIISFNQIFPVLFKHYDSNPVGSVKLYNNESSPITDITLSFFVDRYMDNPKQSSPIENIEGKSAVNLDIYALFSDSVLEITEGTKVST
ncbi:MAG: hypothetical protein KAR21_08265, partial [Spirochaetales bacterium]|nr:hypothetical protein [Spirochaetales bacterium]